MAHKFPSALNRDTTAVSKRLRLCQAYEQNPGSCSSRSCQSLHMCPGYLLNKCRKLESNGKCSHCHSFFTVHNDAVLQREYGLSLDDEKLFEKVAKMIGPSPSAVDQSASMSDDRENMDWTNQETLGRLGRTTSIPNPHRSAVPPIAAERSSTRKSLSSTLSEQASLGSAGRSSRTKSAGPVSRPKMALAPHSVDLEAHETDRSTSSQSVNSPARLRRHVKQASDSDRVSSSVDSERDGAGPSSFRKSWAKIWSGGYSGNKGERSSVADSNDSRSNSKLMRYIFEQYSNAEQLAFLHGPVRHSLKQTANCMIFPSGYCQIANAAEKSFLEKKIDELLPMQLSTKWIPFDDDVLALISCTSAGERVFEQNAEQPNYAIVSRMDNVSVQIEVINPSENGRRRPTAEASANVSSSRPSIEPSKPHPSPSDDRLLVVGPNSSINLTYGDITGIETDMMVCVTTSITLLTSVIERAGRAIKDEYHARSAGKSPFLLSGGATAAEKILFIRWELEIRSSDMRKVSTSLSNLVKDCISEAVRRQAKSITFPSIGTGQLGLDPQQASEVMINAAVESLLQCTMNVIFVLYPSKKGKESDVSYRAFQSHLELLSRSGKLKRADTTGASLAARSSSIAIDTSRSVAETYPCKQIGIVSDAASLSKYQSRLIDSLEQLVVRKSYDLSLVHPSIRTAPDSIVEVCRAHHVLPTIDYSKGQLTLCGDRDSCSQCFASLRQREVVCKYHTLVKIKLRTEEIKMNMYVSLKIDEAIANGDSRIRIQDSSDTTYEFELRNEQVYINESTSPSALQSRKISDGHTASLKPGSTPMPMIRTVSVPSTEFNSMPCTRVFQSTMRPPKWQIERVDEIDNWPMAAHYQRKKDRDEAIYFHSCPFSSVQSIIHYGLHSTSGSVRLTREAMASHISDGQRSTDGRYFMFAVYLSKKISSKDSVELPNEDAHGALPTHLITYRQ